MHKNPVDELYQFVKAGDQSFRSYKNVDALGYYQQAYQLLSADWNTAEKEIATYLLLKMADIHLYLKQFEKSDQQLRIASHSTDSIGNPSYHLLRGKTWWGLQEYEQAKSELLQAYLVGGTMIFQGEHSRYFEMITPLIETTKQTTFYRLERDPNCISDGGVDIWIEGDQLAPELHQLRTIDPMITPDRMGLHGSIEWIQTTDYPCNDMEWPIVSKKMLDVLLSVGSFEHKKIPLLIQDATILAVNPDGTYLHSDEMTEGYVALQFLNNDDRDVNSTPLPVFRIGSSADLCVSAEGKQALQQHKIKGIIYIPFDVT